MTIYVTADLHLGHEQILKHQPNRKFNTISDMNDWIVARWNERVTEKDTVYILGDIAFRQSFTVTANILYQLNGIIKVVPGNHDYNLHKVRDVYQVFKYLRTNKKDVFEILPPIYGIKYCKTKFVFCHYPMETWYGAKRAYRNDTKLKSSIHLHGHSHGSSPVIPFRMDVGYDATGEILTPLDDILNIYYPEN